MNTEGLIDRPHTHPHLALVVGCLALGMAVSTASAQPVAEAERVEVLRMLAARNRHTWDNLKTWSGTFEFEDRELFYDKRADEFIRLTAPGLSSYPDEFRKDVKGRVSFAVDLVVDHLFTRLETSKVDVVDLTMKRTPVGVEPVPFNQTSIVTPDVFLHFEPNVRYSVSEGPGVRMAFSDLPAKAAAQHWGTVVDPREFLGYGRPMWENLEMLADALGECGRLEIDGMLLRMWKEPNEGADEYHVYFPGRIGPERHMIQDMTFSADADYNITLLIVRNTTGEWRQKISWRYTKQDGLFLPSCVEYKEISPSSKGSRIKFQRTLRLTGSYVNRAIHPVTFEYGNLGLQKEDLVLDMQTGERSVYGAGTLTKVPSD